MNTFVESYGHMHEDGNHLVSRRVQFIHQLASNDFISLNNSILWLVGE